MSITFDKTVNTEFSRLKHLHQQYEKMDNPTEKKLTFMQMNETMHSISWLTDPKIAVTTIEDRNLHQQIQEIGKFLYENTEKSKDSNISKVDLNILEDAAKKVGKLVKHKLKGKFRRLKRKIQAQCISFLSFRDLSNLAQVSHGGRHLAHDDSIWRRFNAEAGIHLDTFTQPERSITIFKTTQEEALRSIFAAVTDYIYNDWIVRPARKKEENTKMEDAEINVKKRNREDSDKPLSYDEEVYLNTGVRRKLPTPLPKDIISEFKSLLKETPPEGKHLSETMAGRIKSAQQISLLGDPLTAPPRPKIIVISSNQSSAGKPLTALPHSQWGVWEKFQSLEYLSLGHNKLTDLSEGLGALKLETLNCYRSTLIRLPANLNMTNMRSLDLRDNRFEEFPKVILSASNLVSLMIGGNPIRRLPENISVLTKLLSLDVHKTELRELPDSLWELNELKALQLCGSPISSLSSKVENLTKLETLTLEDTHVSELPESLWKLDHLNFLSCLGAPIEKISPEILKNNSKKRFRFTISVDKLSEASKEIIKQLGAVAKVATKKPNLDELFF